jgi:hypothetical protein
MALTRYTQEGYLSFDNNTAERLVKVPAIGRQNYLFVDRTDQFMAQEHIEIELLPEERAIILRHGYPFERLEKAVKAIPPDRAVGTVRMSAYELQMLIGELSRSFNHDEAGRDEDALLELCDRLEYAEKYGDGTLDILI